MQIAALIAWLVSAVGGLTLAAAYVVRRGYADAIDAARVHHVGRMPGGRPDTEGPAITGGLVGTHALVAVLGLVVLLLWMINEDETGWEHSGWGAFVFALAAAGFGVAMFGSWRARENQGSRAVRALPAPVVYLHGLAGLATIGLVLAAVLLD